MSSDLYGTCSHCIYGTNFGKGGACACVYIKVTMVTAHAHAPPCSKVSPMNIANGGQTDIKFSCTGGIPLILKLPSPEKVLL